MIFKERLMIIMITIISFIMINITMPDLVLPQQLQFSHREEIVVRRPDLDEEELAEGENPPSLPADGLGDLVRGGGGRGGSHILDSFVEGVGGVMATVCPHPLK